MRTWLPQSYCLTGGKSFRRQPATMARATHPVLTLNIIKVYISFISSNFLAHDRLTDLSSIAIDPQSIPVLYL
jgi:hypothetical protein